MRKFLLPLPIVAALVAMPAHADCTAPDVNVTIPDGASATMDDMLKTQRAIRDGNSAVEAYSQCLRGLADAEIAAGGDKLKDQDKQKIAAKYDAIANVVIDKLQGLADKFNVEVRAYKAKQAASAPAK
jgi:hypothetical protein